MENFKKRKDYFNRHRDFRCNNVIQFHAKMESTAVHCTDVEKVGCGIVELYDLKCILRK